MLKKKKQKEKKLTETIMSSRESGLGKLQIKLTTKRYTLRHVLDALFCDFQISHFPGNTSNDDDDDQAISSTCSLFFVTV